MGLFNRGKKKKHKHTDKDRVKNAHKKGRYAPSNINADKSRKRCRSTVTIDGEASVGRRGGDPKTVTIRETKIRIFVEPDNAQTIGMREEQQDAFTFSNVYSEREIEEIGSVAVLADGMGGLADGFAAASTAVEVFLQEYTRGAKNGENISDAMEDAVHMANNAVNRIGGSGSTLIGVVIKDKELNWVSVGDSHLYLLRNGLLRQLNTDHVYGRELDELARRGEISLEEARDNIEREALTSYLGMGNLAEIDRNSGRFPLKIGDIILLCSDGIYKTLADYQIEDILIGAKKSKAQALVNCVKRRRIPNQDNATAVIFKVV